VTVFVEPFGLGGTVAVYTKPVAGDNGPEGPTAVIVADTNAVVGVALTEPVLVRPVRAPSSVTVTEPGATDNG
jgi:hypothetical protein